MRLPRAEDHVIMFIDVDGETVRAEGTVQRVTLRASTGINMLTREIMPTARGVSGEISITLQVMAQADALDDPSMPEPIEVIVRDHGGSVVETIVLPPEIRS